MRRYIAILLSLITVFTLCACGGETPKEEMRDCGVFITVEAGDIYTVSCGTENGSESHKNADDSAISAGEVIHFDFAGDAAIGTDPAVIDYSICIYDKELNTLAIRSFSSDFSNMAKVNITVTADHKIINADDKLVCGGDIVVESKISKPKSDVTLSSPTVTMPNRSDAADAINKSIAELDAVFTGEQYDSSKKTYEANKAAADKDTKVESFSMSRYTRVVRGDGAVLSFKMYDTTKLGTETVTDISGHSYDIKTGKELKLSDIVTDIDKFRTICSEEILVSTTNDELYGDVLFVDGYTDKLNSLITDGHWYFNSDGFVVAAAMGNIADRKYGSFEFVVSYETLSEVLKPEFIPENSELLEGGISVQPSENADMSGLTLIGSDIDPELSSALVSVSGSIFNVEVNKVSYKSDGTFSVSYQLWYCSDMSDGAAFAVNYELNGTPNVMISYSLSDGSCERKLLSLDSGGRTILTNPDGNNAGTVVTKSLPYSFDLDSDGAAEKLSTQKNDSGVISVCVESSDRKLSAESRIKELNSVRIFDLNGDGKTEIFIDGKNSDGKYATCCFVFDGELKQITFGNDKSAYGTVKEFDGGKLVLSKSVDGSEGKIVFAPYSFDGAKFTAA